MASAKRPILLIAAILIAAVTAYRCFVPAASVPRADALRYVNLAMNLIEHGVLSEQPFRPDAAARPGPVGPGPLIIAELSLVALADSASRQTFLCALVETVPRPNCAANLPGLRLVHFVELSVFLFALWLIGRRVLENDLAAILGCLTVMAAGEIFAYARAALTEPLFLMLVTLFLYSWLRAIDEAEGRWHWFAAGCMLGLTVLVKSAFLALLFLSPVLLAPFFYRARGGWRGLAVAILLLTAGYALTAGPFHLRNFLLYGTATLSEPHYLSDSLAHRFGYSLMTLQEWLVAWIYYLPDFGDKLATALFGEQAVTRLGWGDDSLYVYGRDVLNTQSLRSGEMFGAGDVIRALAWEPVNFLGVTLVLFWRGIFVGKYFALAGLVFLPVVLAALKPRARACLLAIALPAFAMAGVHAAVSVSIPRYNLALVPVYACSLAWVLTWLLPARWRAIFETQSS